MVCYCVAPIDIKMLPVSRKWRRTMGYFMHTQHSLLVFQKEKRKKENKKNHFGMATNQAIVAHTNNHHL